MESEFKKTIKDKKDILLVVFTIFLITLIALVLVIISNIIEHRKYIGQELQPRNTISVSGQGEVVAKPDLVIINFSVISEAKTVNNAMQENSQKMNAIINFMKENGIEERDLRTIAFRIEPRYEWHNNEIIRERKERRVLVGYEIIQSLEVRIRNMEKIGTVIQGATNFGANQVGSLQFTIDNKEELKNQARGQAIEKAKKEAKILADQLGVGIIRIVNFQENYDRPFISFPGIAMPEARQDIALTPPEIELGEEKIEITVHITYEIR